jgi:hypothetical protein
MQTATWFKKINYKFTTMSNATLSYDGRISIDTNDDSTIPQTEVDKLHALLDKAIAAYEGDSVVLETAVVHFERGDSTVGTDDMPRAHVSLSAEGDFANLASVEDTLANEIVGIGMETDIATAKDEIQIQ